MRENIYEDKTLQKYLSEIAIYAPLSREEEKEYALRAQKNDSEALQILIRSNLKFVVKIAANYQNRGLSFAELISEGNMGLIKAIEKFEPQKKNKLISYAVWWIKQRILFALAEKTSTIRIPLGKSNVSKKIRKAKLEIRSKEGREATMSEIMEKTDLEKKAIKRIYYQIVTTVSMDIPKYNDSDSSVSIKQFIADEYHLSPQEDYYHERILDKIFENIQKLPERSRFILLTYFGFNDEKPCNYSTIGKMLGLSRERVRQIQNESIRKIFLEVKDYYYTDIDKLLRENI